jgi:nicotinate phosphoribosyltransferase
MGHKYVSPWIVHRLLDEVMEGDIIGGVLDADIYKVTMWQYILRYFPEVWVTIAVINRSRKVRLAEVVRERDLADQLDRVRALRYTPADQAYLRSLTTNGRPMFSEDCLTSLAGLVLSPYDLSVHDGQFDLSFPGRWRDATPWEIPALAVLNELRTRALLKRLSRSERRAIIRNGIARLYEKIAALKAYPGLTFTDFGTRRRFARAWQRYADRVLQEEMPGQFLGTSNIESARDSGLQPIGTSAHELFMVVAAILSATDEGLLGSHNLVLRQWWDLYGYGLSIALTDTFGTDFFFTDMTPDQAREWKGLRHDSGDPFEFGHKAIAFYRKHGINPLDKLLVFSDGLDHDLMIRLWVEFEKLIKVTHGWGTLLTNDLDPRLKPMSIVAKVVMVRLPSGLLVPTVKLSDNPSKHLGPDDQVERYRRVFGYTAHEAVECRV